MTKTQNRLRQQKSLAIQPRLKSQVETYQQKNQFRSWSSAACYLLETCLSQRIYAEAWKLDQIRSQLDSITQELAKQGVNLNQIALQLNRTLKMKDVEGLKPTIINLINNLAVVKKISGMQTMNYQELKTNLSDVPIPKRL